MPVDEHAATFAADGAPSGARQVLGARYELLGLLGSGGMGNVYKARDVELDELVALKVLRPELVGAPGTLDRFRREVKLARRVTHPNVARVFDIGEHGGDRILTMELVDGESLATRLRRDGRMSFAAAVEVARAICAGVGAAHAAGVVHRDLKPDNVLIARDERVVVTDFGIARIAAEGARTVGFVGTPAYMAPEQIDEKAAIDHRADVYAFGAMLYEMLTGEAAWQAESLWALAAARLLEPPPDARARRPDVPSALAELVLACMARDPASRPQAMSAVDGALAAVALPAPSLSPTPPPAPSAPSSLATTGTDKRVAVLPFANLGAKDDEYVADGITEDLIDVLSVVRGLRVRSRGAVMSHKGASRDARDVGRELDVHVVVEGSVRKGPGGFRINARLVSVIDGFQLWARRFDVPEAELLAHNDVIAQAVADALGADVVATPREAADPVAVDLHLRARDAYHRSFSAGEGEAIRLFDEALRHAPDDPRILAGRAMAGAMSWNWDAETRRAALSASERARALAPDLPEAHLSLARIRFLDADRRGAIGAARDALRLAPSYGEAHEVLGRIMLEAGREEGRRHIETAIQLTPTLEFAYLGLAAEAAYRGDWDRVQEVLALPALAQSLVRIGTTSRFVMWRRDVAQAQELLRGLPDVPPGAPRPLVIAKSWLELVAQRTPLPPPPPAFVPLPPEMRLFLLELDVEGACFLDDLPRALAGLAALDALGHQHVLWLEHCPLFDALRALPEAQAIRARYAERSARTVAAYFAPA